MTCEMNDIRRAANRLALTILSAMALLTSGCSEVEGPLPLRPVDSRHESEGRVSQTYGEVRAPKGDRTLTLVAKSALGAPTDGTPEESGFTRSVISPDDAGAAVIWEAGDSIKVQFRRDGIIYYGILKTNQGGSSTAFFTTEDDILGGEDYIFFSPGYEVKSESSFFSKVRIFGLEIPQSQTAVPDGVAAGTSKVYASSASFEDGAILSFTNLPSLLRFRLSGDIASHVREVTLRTTSTVAGMVQICDYEGSPSFSEPGKFSNTNQYSSITLTGDFEAGKEYHIALWPKELYGFEIKFSDGEGNFTTVRTQKRITFERSVVTDIGTIDLGDSFRGFGAISTDPIKYYSATEGTKPVSIAVIPEGFTEEELPLYESLAKMALDVLFDTEPYKTYKDRFNAWILKVASNESGAGITNVKDVDNYFGSKWGANSYSNMRATDNIVFNFVSSNCPDICSGPVSSRKTIDEVPIIMIINDTRYAGKTWSFSSGKGYAMCPWTDNGGVLTWGYRSTVPKSESDPNGGYRSRTEEDIAQVKWSPGDWRNTVVHEFGHAFGRLGDEYWNKISAITSSIKTTIYEVQNTWTVPYGKNISTSYSTTPWDEFLQKRDVLIQKDSLYGRIGKYQGGWDYIFGCWRSEKVSGMMDHRLYFNAWSRYLIVQRIMTLSGDGDDFNFDFWLERDVTADPLRDGNNYGPGGTTRSGDPDRSEKYQYIFPLGQEGFLPPDAPPGLVNNEPAPPRI